MGRFGLLEGFQGHFPRVFQLRRAMAMRRINVAAWACTIGRLIPQPFQMRRLGVGDALGLLLPLGQRLGVDSEFYRRQGLEKGVDHPRIDWIGRNRLTTGVRYCCRR